MLFLRESTSFISHKVQQCYLSQSPPMLSRRESTNVNPHRVHQFCFSESPPVLSLSESTSLISQRGHQCYLSQSPPVLFLWESTSFISHRVQCHLWESPSVLSLAPVLCKVSILSLPVTLVNGAASVNNKKWTCQFPAIASVIYSGLFCVILSFTSSILYWKRLTLMALSF